MGRYSKLIPGLLAGVNALLNTSFGGSPWETATVAVLAVVATYYAPKNTDGTKTEGQ